MFDGMSVEQIQAAQSSITDAEYLAIEREAKYLAASLLMRKETFARHFAWLKKVQEARCPNELATLRYVIRRLSYAFNVSVHSAGLRSLKLGLIDQSEFDEVMESFSAN
jgi:Zn-dependent peptidase ImmA (M78 family)